MLSYRPSPTTIFIAIVILLLTLVTGFQSATEAAEITLSDASRQATEDSDHGNTFLGSLAGQDTVVKCSEIGLGQYYCTGIANTFIGYQAGQSNQHGSYNVCIGSNAGRHNQSGNSNILIGKDAGYESSGKNNVFIGKSAGYDLEGNNKLCIGGNSLIYGEFDNQLVKVNGTMEIATAYTSSDKRWKKDVEPLEGALQKIGRLKGVSYLWRRDEFPKKGFPAGRQLGLIAQEVEKIVPEVVNTDSQGYKSVSYDSLVPLLIEALKEQQQTIAKLQRVTAEQGQAINRLEKALGTYAQR
jgi:hypothetical protein